MENNCNCLKNNTQTYFTPIQLRMPLELETCISFDDPIYTFDEVMKGCNLSQYLKSEPKDSRGRIGFNLVTMLKVILFGYMVCGNISTRKLEKLCVNDIRFRWLLRYEKSFPSHMTINNFQNNYLKDSIENIFNAINEYIFKKDSVDLSHIYIDGTKMEANANKYTWVWKNACLTSRTRLYTKITALLTEINNDVLLFENVKYTTREEYEIEYLETIVIDFKKRFKIDETSFVSGKGHRKSQNQRFYQLLIEYLTKLKDYANKIETCGDKRNSYSKTDKDATFMRVKRDYMGNDQLLPAYNLQFGICDEYIAVADINQYACDMDCFVPLMEKFKEIYGFYPKYPVADAGYGSLNNYIFCKQNNMELFMKFGSYNKETKDMKFHNDPFRPINFTKDSEGNLICPNNKKFNFLKKRPVKGNKYGREEEIYACEDCTNCTFKSKCCKAKGNRVINVNTELTEYHNEVINNLESIHGALLRMNRSIQSEGTFGILKEDRKYKRIVRKGLNPINLEIFMISCGYNLRKYYNKKYRDNFCC